MKEIISPEDKWTEIFNCWKRAWEQKILLLAPRLIAKTFHK